MSLIVMVVFDTEANDRTKYTRRALESLTHTTHNRFVVVNNNSCEASKHIIDFYCDSYGGQAIHLDKNIGTAEGWNLGARLRQPGEHVIKIDNDIVINGCTNWVEQMENVVRLDPKIGQVGLKRKDCIEHTKNENPFYKSVIRQLPHTPGEPWVIVESQFHIMGSCVLHSSALLDKIGYMYQCGVYGFDDSFMSYRARVAKFDTVMLPHINIDHIDEGANPYTQEKQELANKVWEAGLYKSELVRFAAGDYYYNPFG